jgi:hypothetical protein
VAKDLTLTGNGILDLGSTSNSAPQTGPATGGQTNSPCLWPCKGQAAIATTAVPCDPVETACKVATQLGHAAGDLWTQLGDCYDGVRVGDADDDGLAASDEVPLLTSSTYFAKTRNGALQLSHSRIFRQRPVTANSLGAQLAGAVGHQFVESIEGGFLVSTAFSEPDLAAVQLDIPGTFGCTMPGLRGGVH